MKKSNINQDNGRSDLDTWRTLRLGKLRAAVLIAIALLLTTTAIAARTIQTGDTQIVAQWLLSPNGTYQHEQGKRVATLHTASSCVRVDGIIESAGDDLFLMTETMSGQELATFISTQTG